MTSILPPGALACGMQLPVQAHSELFVAERTSGPDELDAITHKADETGFLYVAVCDHVVIAEALAPKKVTTLDHLSKGRVVRGFGAGHVRVPGPIALLRSSRESAGRGDDPIDIGTIRMDLVSLGASGAQEQDRAAGAVLALREMGVRPAKIRCMASSLDELVDQMDRFGAEVAPSLSTR